MKKLFMLLLSLLSLSLMPAFAKEWRVITELDVLPYATGGYYFSGGLVKMDTMEESGVPDSLP